MQVRFIMILHVEGYNSLSNLTLHYEIQMCLNTNQSELVNLVNWFRSKSLIFKFSHACENILEGAISNDHGHKVF